MEILPRLAVIGRDRLRAAGCTFVNAPRTEAYGRVVVFIDIFGNKWDLLGPAQ